jgi:electron transfer flavoprotein alpha subunit
MQKVLDTRGTWGAPRARQAAVDAAYAPNDWQVGQTGKIVAPQLHGACLDGTDRHDRGHPPRA